MTEDTVFRVPHATVRDWRRRFACRAGLLAAGLGALAVEVGAGKTVAVRAAVSQLDRTRYQVIYV